MLIEFLSSFFQLGKLRQYFSPTLWEVYEAPGNMGLQQRGAFQKNRRELAKILLVIVICKAS